MKINKRINVLVVTGILMLGGPVGLAQDDTPTKRQGVEYLRIVFVDYKLDKRNEARGIIDDHFAPASQAAGTPEPLMVLHFQTGEWDTIVLWALEEGMTELEWTQITPNFVKWKAELDKQVGGEDEGWDLMNRFNAAIARRRIEIAHHHVE